MLYARRLTWHGLMPWRRQRAPILESWQRSKRPSKQLATYGKALSRGLIRGSTPCRKCCCCLENHSGNDDSVSKLGIDIQIRKDLDLGTVATRAHPSSLARNAATAHCTMPMTRTRISASSSALAKPFGAYQCDHIARRTMASNTIPLRRISMKRWRAPTMTTTK
jgi:hypothetical protein